MGYLSAGYAAQAAGQMLSNLQQSSALQQAADSINRQFSAQGLLRGSNHMGALMAMTPTTPSLASLAFADFERTFFEKPKPRYTVWHPTPQDARHVERAEELIGRIDFWRQIPLFGHWRAGKAAAELDTLTDRMERNMRENGILVDASADHPQG